VYNVNLISMKFLKMKLIQNVFHLAPSEPTQISSLPPIQHSDASNVTKDVMVVQALPPIAQNVLSIPTNLKTLEPPNSILTQTYSYKISFKTS
jgi:hypothetical protein